MEQRTVKIGDRIIYCYEDGSVEFLSRARQYSKQPLVRTFGFNDGRGYKGITLSINEKKTVIKVHRLIALAFHPNPNSLPEVDHVNRDSTDNRPSNLRWCDRKTNNDNRGYVDRAFAKYGVRLCDNKKAYFRVRRQHCLNMITPDGRCSTTGSLTPEVYDTLKPLSQRERYSKYLELKKTNA